MTTIMIVGAGRLQLPAFHEARTMGLRVVAIDRDPDACGMKLADAPYAIDTRDDKEAIRVARKEHIDGVMTLCTDFPVRTVAAVASALKIPGLDPEVALRATHKGHMRDAFVAGGASTPRHRRVLSEAEALAALDDIGLPVIVKPVSCSGSRGVYKVERTEQMKDAWEHAKTADPLDTEAIVEQYIEGPEVSVEFVSWCGWHQAVAITDKLTTGNPHWVETGHIQPSRLAPEAQASIVDCAKGGLTALGIQDSTSHVEIKLGPEGPVLIEIGARLGGDFISTELTLRSTGVSMPRAAISIALGQKPDLAPQRSRAAAIRYFMPPPCIVGRVEGLADAQQCHGVKVVQVYVAPGDTIPAVRSSLDRSGHIIAEGPTGAEAICRANKAMAALHVVPLNKET